MAEKKKRTKKGKNKPGVFVEEIPSGVRPIGAVGTAVAAFVGLAPLKPLRLTVTALAVAAVVRAARSR
jgi:phage tail sheath protein FI